MGNKTRELERFFNWLARKYGYDDEMFYKLDEDFQDILEREYASIAASYGYGR